MATFTSFKDIRRAALSYAVMASFDCDELREKIAALLTKEGTAEIDLTDYPEMTADLLAAFICRTDGDRGSN